MENLSTSQMSPAGGAGDPQVPPRLQKPQSWSENLLHDHQRGTGLLLACERAKQLTTVHRKAIALLLETTNLYDTYGQALLQCSQAFQSDISSNNNNNFLQHDLDAVRGIAQWVEQRGTTYSHTLAKPMRHAHVLPLQKFLVTHGDCATHVPERYQASGTAVVAVHQKVRTAKTVFQTADQEAAKAISEWRINNNNNSQSENLNPATTTTPFPKHVTTKLSQVLACQARHKRMMDWEQECVRQRQRMQVMGLETMQKLEEDRLVIILHSLTKLLITLTRTTPSPSGKQPLNDTTKEQQQQEEEQEQDTSLQNVNSTSKLRNGIGVISSIIESKNSVDFLLPEDEDPGDASCSGVMDCETLGLPLDIGELRDRVCHEAAARESAVQVARSLAALLDRVATAARTFAQGLDGKVAVTTTAVEGMAPQVGFASVAEDMEAAAESVGIKVLWSVLSNCLKKERDFALDLADQVESLRSEYLDHVIEYGNTVLIPAVKRDDATWKQLCGAARSESTAESRFMETTAQTARIRERCKSVGDSAALNASSLAPANKHVSQSLASMFSILPNGGEHAMKVLDASTRASVAQLSLDEANQREAKDRQLLDSAIALTELSIDAYKTQADKALKEFGETCLELAPLAESFASRVEIYLDFSAEVKDMRSVDPYTVVPATLDTWLLKAQAELKSLQPERTDVEESTELVHSDIVRRCLADMKNTDFPMIDADASMNDASETDAYDDLSIPPLSSPLRERAESTSSWGSPTSNQTEEKSTGWLLRSLTMPERSDSIFGKLSMKKVVPRMRQPKFDDLSTESNIFATFFWPENVDPNTIPDIAESFACSFRDGAQLLPFQYGRLFLSKERLVFVSWTRKHLALKWFEVLSIKSIKNSVSLQDDSIVVKCRKGPNDESYMMLSGFYDRKRTVELIQMFQEQATAPGEPVSPTFPDSLRSTSSSPTKATRVVPPDATLGKMEAILSRTIHHTTVQEFFDIVWSEKNNTNETAFYKSFLERECFDVDVGAWDRNETTRSWCGETYSQSRLIKFRVKRKTHTYIGPPIAEVTQTHCCRVEGNDKCVVQMTVEFEGIPYADCFAVEIRWVARREGDDDLRVEAGVEVDFRKTTFLKSKIRSGTIEETSVVHKELFLAMVRACAAAKGDATALQAAEAEEANDTVISKPGRVETKDWKSQTLQMLSQLSVVSFDNMIAACGALVLLMLLWRWLAARKNAGGGAHLPPSLTLVDEVAALGSSVDKLEAEVKAIHDTLQEILAVLRSKNA